MSLEAAEDRAQPEDPSALAAAAGESVEVGAGADAGMLVDDVAGGDDGGVDMADATTLPAAGTHDAAVEQEEAERAEAAAGDAHMADTWSADASAGDATHPTPAVAM